MGVHLNETVLVVNVGSSSLKWSHFDAQSSEELGTDSIDLTPFAQGGGDALSTVLAGLPRASAIGHRIVHGGALFRESAIVNDEVRGQLTTLAPLDPLHMNRALQVLDHLRQRWPETPQVVAFDTAFHGSLPEEAALYPLPFRWTEEHRLRRFGFHGLSVDYAVHRAAAMLGGMPARALVCHLGSGCSMTAVRDGKSIDTTMGFSPLEGLMMGTRSGSLDPGLMLYLLRRPGFDPAMLEDAIETQSGLFGVSGESSDLRVILKRAEEGSPRAKRAYAMFIQSLRRWFGAMLGSLGGLDAVVFTGGIGEHSPQVRADVALAFGFAGVEVDEKSNLASAPDTRLTRSAPRIGGTVEVLLIQAREDLVILRDMQRLLWPGGGLPGRAPGQSAGTE